MARHSRIPMTVIGMRPPMGSRRELLARGPQLRRMLYQLPQVVLLSQNVTKTKIVLRKHVQL